MATLSWSPCLRIAQRPEPLAEPSLELAASHSRQNSQAMGSQHYCKGSLFPSAPPSIVSHSDRRMDGQGRGSRQEPNQTGSGEEGRGDTLRTGRDGPWTLKNQEKGGSEASGLDLAVFSPVISQPLHLS